MRTINGHFVLARLPGPRSLSRAFAILATASVVLAACGGGGGGGSSVPSAPTGSSTTAPPSTTQTQSVPVSTTSPQTTTYSLTSYGGTATIPAGNVATTLSTTFSTAQPGGTPTIQNLQRRPQNIGGTGPIGAIAFLCATPAATVTLAAYPSFTLIFPTSPPAGNAYVALFDPTNAAAGWTTIEGPATVAGSTLSFSGATPGPTLQAGRTYCLLFFTLASALPTPTPTPTATATSTSGASLAFTCPPNDSVPDVLARSAAPAGTDAVRRAAGLRVTRTRSNATGLLAVTYNAAAASGSRATTLAAREQSAGGILVRQLTFSRTAKVIRVLSVPVAQMGAIAATLRSQSDVESVAPTGLRRYSSKIATPYFPNDPYFNGFTSTQNTNAGNPSATTFQVAPFEESSVVPGQWDMHAIKLEDALAYSQSGNGSTITNVNALGSSSVKIAIIDTGEDPTHPELSSKIAYQRCFVTNAAGTAQSTSNFETDPLGHGTDVSGIAAADTNNSFGFAGVGGKVVIYAYRVFPTPDDNCASDFTSDPQCGASTQDIADAIDDAVTQGVNVISMSLGGEACSSSGVDSDPVEGAAVAEAIAHNVIVVAASGNSGGGVLGTPACDSGVIAVGATSLADGNPNGSGNSLGTSSSPVEYVATYTQYGANNIAHNANSWGIVAPGGDPSGGNDNDNLHWIENIWTSTPFQSSSSDQNFTGECTNDYPNGTTATSADCRTLIAGTSMATPHVAGAAALILSATGGTGSAYQSPAAMRALLCQTADNINSSIQGCGRLNVYNAMATALNDPSLPTPIP
jgi:subtilisin family serine protease